MLVRLVLLVLEDKTWVVLCEDGSELEQVAHNTASHFAEWADDNSLLLVSVEAAVGVGGVDVVVCLARLTTIAEVLPPTVIQAPLLPTAVPNDPIRIIIFMIPIQN
jgi:hypothetical protein